MNQPVEWRIPGDNPLASRLREAARYVPTASAITIATEASDVTPEAFVLGPVVLEAGERIVPFYAAFEAIEEIARAIAANEIGRVYGCFASFRVARGAAGDDLVSNALLPIVALALDLLPSSPTRVWARRASLFAADDAWFVTLRLADETIVTLEALASNAPGSGQELLVEVTGSEQVLRAEPTRQAVIVEPLDGAATAHPWWEDLAERYLRLVIRRAAQPADGSGARLCAVWGALMQSAERGQPGILSA